MEDLISMAISLFTIADKSLLNLSQRYTFLHLLRHFLSLALYFFLFLLRFFFSVSTVKSAMTTKPYLSPSENSAIGRSLSMLLSVISDIPVQSRKYEIVRNLAEKLLDDNIAQFEPALRRINQLSLSRAFSNTLYQLESAMAEKMVAGDEGTLSRFIKAASSVAGVGDKGRESLVMYGSAEKLASEILWIARKMDECGGIEEALVRWGSASRLAWFSLSAEPRLQASFVKVSVFLLKKMEELERRLGGGKRGDFKSEEDDDEFQSQEKTKMLMSWLPLLCHATNGPDTPNLTTSERVEMEAILEKLVEKLNHEEQEKVLSLWLHHYTSCPNSDWPNLQPSYLRWYSSAQKLLLLEEDKEEEQAWMIKSY